MRLAHRFWGKKGNHVFWSFTYRLLLVEVRTSQGYPRYQTFIMGPCQTFELGLQNGQMVWHNFHIQLYLFGDFLFDPPILDPSLPKSSSHTLGLEMSKDLKALPQEVWMGVQPSTDPQKVIGRLGKMSFTWDLPPQKDSSGKWREFSLGSNRPKDVKRVILLVTRRDDKKGSQVEEYLHKTSAVRYVYIRALKRLKSPADVLGNVGISQRDEHITRRPALED